MAKAFIGLGTNLGDKYFNLSQAIEILLKADAQIIAKSPVYETPPWGNTDQPAFLNQVIEVEWKGTADALMELLLRTEAALGRIRTDKWGPRTIDLDLLDFEGFTQQSEQLNLPHPWLAQRAFVLVPWAEIAPAHVPAGMQQTILQMLDHLPEEEVKAVIRMS